MAGAAQLVGTWRATTAFPEVFALCFKLRGRDLHGFPVIKEIPVSPILVNPAYPVSPEARALRKALAVRDEVEALCGIIDPWSCRRGERNWHSEIDRVGFNLRTALEALGGDEELARDAAEWEAVAGLKEKDIQALRREWEVRIPGGQRFRRGVANAGVAGAVVVGGTVLVAGGIPLAFLCCLLSLGRDS